MNISGKNLIALELALMRAIHDVKTEYGTDPDCDADELEDEAKEYKRLLVRVRSSLKKEETK